MEILEEDKGVYYGEHLQGVKTGFGVYEWKDGSSYEGEWEDNMLSGYGVLRAHDNALYAGLFHKNKLNGAGRCIFPNGDLYIGDWRKGKIHGFGVFYTKRSNTFELSQYSKGNIAKTVNKGIGKPTELDLIFTNRMSHPYIFNENRYVGEATHGKRQGRGILYMGNGCRFEANWINDRPNGVCVFFYNDFLWDIGNYENGRLHGLGKKRFANGDIYFGQFSYGKMHGNGEFYSKELDRWMKAEFFEDNII